MKRKRKNTNNFATCEVKVMQNGEWLLIIARKIKKILPFFREKECHLNCI